MDAGARLGRFHTALGVHTQMERSDIPVESAGPVGVVGPAQVVRSVDSWLKNLSDTCPVVAAVAGADSEDGDSTGHGRWDMPA